jgi:hypothetical protein
VEEAKSIKSNSISGEIEKPNNSTSHLPVTLTVMLHNPDLYTSPVPLFIAVTGHKNLVPEKVTEIRESITEQLDNLISCRGIEPESVRMLTGLAEGSDTLLAEISLDLGIPVVAVLPMPQDSYEEEFSTPQALARFRELLELAHTRIEIPLEPGTTMNQVSLIANQGAFTEKRTMQYAALGRYLAATADILVALWDGKPFQPNQAGGTAHVVQMFLQGADGETGQLKQDKPNSNGPKLLMHCKVSRLGAQRQEDAATIQFVDPDGHPEAKP